MEITMAIMQSGVVISIAGILAYKFIEVIKPTKQAEYQEAQQAQRKGSKFSNIEYIVQDVRAQQLPPIKLAQIYNKKPSCDGQYELVAKQ